MRIVRSFALGLAALTVIALIVTPSGAFAQADGASTVGDFLASYAKALRIELPATASPEIVITALQASGIKLDAKLDPAKALTQADVVKIGKANGVRLTTRNPEAPFSTAEIDQFFTVYGPTLSPSRPDASSTVLDAAHPNPGTGKGKGKQKGHQSPTEPN